MPVDKAEAERVARRFLDAANAGDPKRVEATFAENARFDSVGRIYPSRADIMNRFLIPEVLDVGGRYKVTGSRWDGDRYVVNYDFKTSGGAAESFSYAFLIQDGLIRDVVGRY
ncbi:nuclear transport factor 2 family protein [Actinomadura spongiicola]|uniref:nuclear transport factor 2 family protein n=1 Tax=Actinomadura spongiicola TaxID=2303421 RepID=UPI0013149A4F|nr:nuclear transport factor 2 family protein [Actinomadura spongiicola]